MSKIVPLLLDNDQLEQLIHLSKHASHWRERQRAQTILWLSEGKTVLEVASLQNRISETIRFQRRLWLRNGFDSIAEGYRSGRPNTLTAQYRELILEWVKNEPLNAAQIRSKLFDLHQVSIPVMGIRKFLRESGMVFKRTRHSLKKKG
jgi:transposase